MTEFDNTTKSSTKTSNADCQATPNRLEDWAQREPNRVALIQGERSLSYAQWNEQANRIAHSLQNAGIGPDDIVALRLQNTIEWALLNAALAKLGAGLLGMNWRLTPNEINYILKNSQASGFICDDANPASLLPAFDGISLKIRIAVNPDPTASLEPFNPFAALLDAPLEPPFYSTADARLVIYTSGTTGFPKGVVANRTANDPQKDQEIKEYLASMRSETDHGLETVLVTMPMHHAAGPSIVRTAVSRGSTLILMPRFDAETVLQLIDRHKVTTWNGVPTMFKRIASLPDDVLAQYDVSSIHSLSVGAAPVPPSLKQWIVDYFGPHLRESYGSTEVSMVSALPPEMHAVKPGSSGKPFRHVKVSVRDEQGCEVATGQPGELWVYTPVAINHYLGADKLGEDTIDKDGFFRMGDVGYLDEDGYLYITDRTKDMIISGGVNLYPAEIEAAIIQHPAVQDVAVIGIPDEEFGEQVKAFCELKNGAQVTTDELHQFAAQQLASYKRPKSIEIVNELPRNTMGKLLKRELRDPYWQDKERKV